MKHRFADCSLDDSRLTLTRGGEPVAVEPKVFDLLHLLVRNEGKLVTRDQMMDEVWHGRIVSESAISACIATARKAVGDDGKTQAIIRTVIRRGLMLVTEVTREADETTSAPPPTAPVRPTETQRIRYCRSEAGHAIAFALSGEGPPVLRFGAPMTSDLEWEWAYGLHRSCKSSASDFTRYLRFDSLGSGQSERVEPVRDFGEQARIACAVADAAGFDTFAGVSFSGGCLAAIHFAALYPERLKRLAIVGGYAEGRSLRQADPPPDALKGMIAEGWAGPGNALNTAFVTAYFPEGPAEAAEQVMREMQAACPPETMLKDRDAINSASVLHLLDKVRCPTLVLHGRGDAVHPLSQAQKLAAGIPGAELVVLETANHVPLYGSACWDTYNQTLAEFLLG